MASVCVDNKLKQLAANRGAHTDPMSAEMTGKLIHELLESGMGGAAAGGVVELFVTKPKLSPQVAAAILDAAKLLFDVAGGTLGSDRGGVQGEGLSVGTLGEGLPSVAHGTSTEPKRPSPLAMPRRKGELPTRSPKPAGSPSSLLDGATVALREPGRDRGQEASMSQHAKSVLQLLAQEQRLFGSEAVEQHPEAVTLALSRVVYELMPKTGNSFSAEERARRLVAIKRSNGFPEAASALGKGSDGKEVKSNALQPIIGRQEKYVGYAKGALTTEKLKEILGEAIEDLAREDETPPDSDSGDDIADISPDAQEEPTPTDQIAGEVDTPKDPTVLTELSQYLSGEDAINPKTAIRLAYEDLYTNCPKTSEFGLSRAEVAATWWRLGLGNQKEYLPDAEPVISSAKQLSELLDSITCKHPYFLHDQSDMLTALKSFVEDIPEPRHFTGVTVSLMQGSSKDDFPNAEKVKYCLISGLSQLYDVVRKSS
ncbi:hypothetical protein FWD20_00335 [Candidatus Saccharibacteria bacterium]|nr:hypothetical protein [Candidatus Saccharibacteria bacterium]